MLVGTWKSQQAKHSLEKPNIIEKQKAKEKEKENKNKNKRRKKSLNRNYFGQAYVSNHELRPPFGRICHGNLLLLSQMLRILPQLLP